MKLIHCLELSDSFFFFFLVIFIIIFIIRRREKIPRVIKVYLQTMNNLTDDLSIFLIRKAASAMDDHVYMYIYIYIYMKMLHLET